MALRRPLLLLAESRSSVGIDTKNYEKRLKRTLEKFRDASEERAERAQASGVSRKDMVSALKRVGFPGSEKFVDSVERGGSRLPFYDFVSSNADREDVYEVSYLLRGFARQAEDVYDDKQLKVDFARLVSETTDSMRAISGLIKRAVSRVPDWSGSRVIIVADHQKDSIEASQQADVVLSHRMSRAPLRPGFTVWLQGRSLVVEDVLDAGDPEFFSKTDSSLSGDYFGLVGELREPGSSRKKGRVLTLFTARPAEERSLYRRAKTVPSNIFVSSNLNRVVGIAAETLFGREGKRDVYRLRINERYLNKTLDTGKIKDYQTFHRSGKVPVENIERL